MVDWGVKKNLNPSGQHTLTTGSDILKDPHQVLFEPCAFGGGQCGEAVFSPDEAPLCRRHYAAVVLPSSTSTATQVRGLSRLALQHVHRHTGTWADGLAHLVERRTRLTGWLSW